MGCGQWAWLIMPIQGGENASPPSSPLKETLVLIIYHVCFTDEAWMGKEPEPNKLLELIQYRDSNNVEREFRLIQAIQGHCVDLGIFLGIDQGTLDGIEAKNPGNLKRRCADILNTWKMKMKGDYEITWGGLLRALRDAQLNSYASHLKNALTLYYKQAKQEL